MIFPEKASRLSGNFPNRPFTSSPEGATMKIDQNKKILMVVVLVLYILYKMMGG
jgi:hypothetical protein